MDRQQLLKSPAGRGSRARREAGDDAGQYRRMRIGILQTWVGLRVYSDVSIAVFRFIVFFASVVNLFESIFSKAA